MEVEETSARRLCPRELDWQLDAAEGSEGLYIPPCPRVLMALAPSAALGRRRTAPAPAPRRLEGWHPAFCWMSLASPSRAESRPGKLPVASALRRASLPANKHAVATRPTSRWPVGQTCTPGRWRAPRQTRALVRRGTGMRGALVGGGGYLESCGKQTRPRAPRSHTHSWQRSGDGQKDAAAQGRPPLGLLRRRWLAVSPAMFCRGSAAFVGKVQCGLRMARARVSLVGECGWQEAGGAFCTSAARCLLCCCRDGWGREGPRRRAGRKSAPAHVGRSVPRGEDDGEGTAPLLCGLHSDRGRPSVEQGGWGGERLLLPEGRGSAGMPRNRRTVGAPLPL